MSAADIFELFQVTCQKCSVNPILFQAGNGAAGHTENDVLRYFVSRNLLREPEIAALKKTAPGGRVLDVVFANNIVKYDDLVKIVTELFKEGKITGFLIHKMPGSRETAVLSKEELNKLLEK